MTRIGKFTQTDVQSDFVDLHNSAGLFLEKERVESRTDQ